MRYIVFVILWIYMIAVYSENLGISILLFAAAMGIFFFLSLQRVSIYLYILLSIIIFKYGILLMEENQLTILLLIYVSIISSLRLQGNRLKIYIILNFVLSLVIAFLQEENIIGLAILAGFLYFLILSMNHYQNNLKEQQNLYEQLLGEYRKQKRMNVLAGENARTEERNRIARDIHDSVGHRLTALIMKLEMLTIQTKNETYREMKKMAEESLAETRQAVKALQTEESEGILTVVNLIRKLEAESHLVVQFTLKQGVLSIPLSNDKSVVLYRVLQEALTNAMRHANTREVQVLLGKSANGDLTFEVSNVVHQPKPFAYGFGLSNMKHRLEETSGRLEVYQTEKQFIVTGTIPA